MKRLLLISSSKTHGTGFLDHCESAIRQHFTGLERILFVPYALADRDAYAGQVRSRLGELGLRVDSIHDAANAAQAIQDAQAIFIGGGNSFRLLKTLYDQQLLDPIRERVAAGMPYMGSSAGTNMACPTIRTTNDMPIVEPPSLKALGLIPFQINPHFIDANADTQHQGETRETRLRQYLEENEGPVLGIREGSWLVITGNAGTLHGESGGIVFRRQQDPSELSTNAVFAIDDLRTKRRLKE